MKDIKSTKTKLAFISFLAYWSLVHLNTCGRMKVSDLVGCRTGHIITENLSTIQSELILEFPVPPKTIGRPKELTDYIKRFFEVYLSFYKDSKTDYKLSTIIQDQDWDSTVEVINFTEARLKGIIFRYPENPDTACLVQIGNSAFTARYQTPGTRYGEVFILDKVLFLNNRFRLTQQVLFYTTLAETDKDGYPRTHLLTVIPRIGYMEV